VVRLALSGFDKSLAPGLLIAYRWTNVILAAGWLVGREKNAIINGKTEILIVQLMILPTSLLPKKKAHSRLTF